MRIQYILHADFETPGIIQTWAQQNQFKENICRPFADDLAPSRFVQSISELLANDFEAINKIMIQILENLIKARQFASVL